MVKTDFDHEKIEQVLGYSFKNKDLLEQAFTRSSYKYENITNQCEDNEVLEFIGDSVLGMLVAKRLSERYKAKVIGAVEREALKKAYSQLGYEYQDPKNHFRCMLDENELSQLKISLVCQSALAEAMDRLDLAEHLRLGKADINDNVIDQPSIKEDLFEAIIGAVAIDSGWDLSVLEMLIERMLPISQTLERYLYDEGNYERLLRDILAEIGHELEIIDNENSKNPCENLKYNSYIVSDIFMFNERFDGYGDSMKEAHGMAAKLAYESLSVFSARTRTILETIGQPQLENSVNQLQELYQKGVISEPRYEFNCPDTASNGNPQWECIVSIEGLVEEHISPMQETKKNAKKLAAFEILVSLMGRIKESEFMSKFKMGEFKPLNTTNKSGKEERK